MYQYDMTDYDAFSNYEGGCKCGGQCSSCRAESMNYCGCSHNYVGYDEPIVSEPVVAESKPAVKVEPVTKRTFPLGVNKKVATFVVIGALAYFGYKYMKKK